MKPVKKVYAHNIALGAIPGRAQLAARHAEAVAAMRWPTLLTLTRVAHKGTLTTARLRDTMRAFARLRRSPAWAGVKGGVGAVEATNDGRGWADHVHAIVDAEWLDIKPLIAAWIKALRGPGSVHIQRIHQPVAALKYITKNQHVAADALVIAQGMADELDTAMRAPYLTTAFGSCGPGSRKKRGGRHHSTVKRSNTPF